MNKLKSIYASACSASVTIFSVTAVTIFAELSPAFKNWLTKMSGHHWVTKSYMSLIVFAFFYYLFFAKRRSLKLLPLNVITFYQGFDSTEDSINTNRLRAGPAAPDSTPNRCDK